ncbi:hypothetical protein SK128_003795, partial [Halocaridina rubra]
MRVWENEKGLLNIPYTRLSDKNEVTKSEKVDVKCEVLVDIEPAKSNLLSGRRRSRSSSLSFKRKTEKRKRCETYKNKLKEEEEELEIIFKLYEEAIKDNKRLNETEDLEKLELSLNQISETRTDGKLKETVSSETCAFQNEMEISKGVGKGQNSPGVSVDKERSVSENLEPKSDGISSLEGKPKRQIKIVMGILRDLRQGLLRTERPLRETAIFYTKGTPYQ